MPVTSLIVESLPGEAATTWTTLAHVDGVSVHGMKEEQIVTVIEGESISEIDTIMRKIQALEGVVGVYPVYTGGHVA